MAVVRFCNWGKYNFWKTQISVYLSLSPQTNQLYIFIHKQKDLKAQTDSFIWDPQKCHASSYLELELQLWQDGQQ